MARKRVALACALLLAAAAAIGAGYMYESNKQAYNADFTGFVPILIDAGHGGGDPGKVGRLAYESEINLEIAKKLERLLTLRGFMPVMTRQDEKGLVEDGMPWKKSVDSKLRRAIIDNSSASLMVSIHQNSHQNAASQGAQVFYNDKLEENRTLAEIMQRKMAEIATMPNKRQTVCNNEFFVLRGNSMPSCMIECGFISNKREEALLNSDEYQEKIAKAIYEGILEFFNLKP